MGKSHERTPMKILLVNPYQVHLVNKKGKIYNRVWPPLSLANCAALLREKRHGVRIIDGNAERLEPHTVAKLAHGFDKIFITSTSIDRWQCPNIDTQPFLDTVTALRKISKEIFIIGSHATVNPEKMLTLTDARAVIRGEPEMTVLDICEGTELADVKGITFRNNGSIVSTEERAPLELNSLPVPAFDLLPMHRYNYELLGNKFTLFEGSRGCPSRCIFCLKVMYGNKIRKKSPERLIKEVEYAIINMGVRTAYFMDLEFTLYPEMVHTLCDYLIDKKHDFKWTCQTRLDKIDKAILVKMKKAGCMLIHFGVETGSERILKIIDKGITLEQIRNGINLVHSVGIQTACFFMFGFPTETLNDVNKTIDFAKRLNPTYAAFHIATPYRGTKFYTMVKDKLDDSDFFAETYEGDLDLKTLRNLSRKAYFQYYLRPTYILSRILRGEFRSLGEQINLFWRFLLS